MTTAEIQGILVKSASDLIDLDAPNYQYVAARLLLFGLRKNLYGRIHELPTLLDQIKRGVDKGIYDGDILNKYTESEIEDLDKIIDHERDYLFTYAGLRQVVDKYLVQDRSTGALYETPQFMYLLIAMTIFAEYPPENRIDYVTRYYNAISRHKINIPTPIMGGVRTPIRNLRLVFWLMLTTPWIVFLVLICIIGRYVAQRTGIGINASTHPWDQQ